MLEESHYQLFLQIRYPHMEESTECRLRKAVAWTPHLIFFVENVEFAFEFRLRGIFERHNVLTDNFPVNNKETLHQNIDLTRMLLITWSKGLLCRLSCTRSSSLGRSQDQETSTALLWFRYHMHRPQHPESTVILWMIEETSVRLDDVCKALKC